MSTGTAGSTDPPVPPEWDAPFPYGHMTSIESAGGVAAPLLAGFAFALIGLVVTSPGSVRFADAALSCFVAAAVLLIAAVQCAFWAREWTIAPGELVDWKPDPGTSHDRRVDLQRLHRAGFRIWANRFRWTYRWGIVVLLAGIAIVLVPDGDVGALRWVAIAIAWLGFLGELLWIASGALLRGHPVGTWSGVPDEPDAAPVHLARLRRSPAARRVARRLIPLPRVDRRH